jgi:hypothetical protein
VGVRRLVEVVGPDDAGGVGDGLLVEHHRPEQGLLGLEVVGRDATGRRGPAGSGVGVGS